MTDGSRYFPDMLRSMDVSILLGAVILVIGFWLANIVANVVQRGEYNSSRWLGNLVRILIMGLVIAMGLRAMGIADSIVNLAFGLTLGSVAVAFALAFGLGGRQPAERLLTDLIDKCQKEANEPNPVQKKAEAKKDSTLTNTADITLAPKQESTPNQFDVRPDDKPLNNPFGSHAESKDDDSNNG